MSTKPGRNDPCPCGSGKKYKNCHLREDQKPQNGHATPDLVAPAATVTNAPVAAGEPEETEAVKLRRSLEAIKNDPRPEIEKIRRRSELLLEFLEHKTEIEAARIAIKPYVEDFRKIIADDHASMEMAEKVFHEDVFIPLRFSPEEIANAVKINAGVFDLSDRQGVVAKLRNAILYLADKNWRDLMSAALSARIPHYVNQSRFMDAWMVQWCADTLFNLRTEVNPFMYVMFIIGYDEWLAAQKQTPPTSPSP